MRLFKFLFWLLGVAGSSVAAECQVDVPTLSAAPISSAATERLASVAQARVLTNGAVIVNDNTGRRILRFDSTLRQVKVIADSTGAAGLAYGSKIGGLIAYKGDSTLFVDPSSLSMVVIDPQGNVGRTIAIPGAGDANSLIGGPFGTPGFDSRGRLVYRALIRAKAMQNERGEPLPPQPADSSLIVAFDFITRRLDTIATFGIPKLRFNRITVGDGLTMIDTTVDPLPWTDDWAVLADGSIAIARGRDYRLEIVQPTGTRVFGPKTDFPWHRLTDEEKLSVIDSTRRELEKLRSPGPRSSTGPGGTGPTRRDSAVTERRPDREDAQRTVHSLADIAPPPIEFVSPTEMADYRPAFRQGATRGDADGNVWIRTSRVVDGGAVYDVFNSTGRIRAHVVVPPGRVIAGFGESGTILMGVLTGAGANLERATVRVP